MKAASTALANNMKTASTTLANNMKTESVVKHNVVFELEIRLEKDLKILWLIANFQFNFNSQNVGTCKFTSRDTNIVTIGSIRYASKVHELPYKKVLSN